MGMKRFYLAGSAKTTIEVDSDDITSLEAVRNTLGKEFSVVQPEGLSYHPHSTWVKRWYLLTPAPQA